MRRLLVILLAVAPAYAQILDTVVPRPDVATTGDGSVLYFDTTLPRQGTGEASQGRIYMIGPGGLSLFASVPEVATASGTDYFWLSQPEVSRDGSVISYVGTRICSKTVACDPYYSQTTVLGAPGHLALTVPGHGHLSGNGRYLFVYVYDPGTSIHDPLGEVIAYVLDLQTGLSTTNFGLPPVGAGSGGYYPLTLGRVVADDGTVLVWANDSHPSDPGRVYLVKNGNFVWTGPLNSGIGLAAIDAAAQVVAFVSPSPNPENPGYAIGICRASEGTCTSVGPPDGNSSAPMVSADGTRVLFLSTVGSVGQMYIANTDGSGLRQVTQDPNGVQSAIMSDDGNVAWYWSGLAETIQVNLNTGQAQERLPTMPQLNLVGGLLDEVLFPGSMVTISGAGLTNQTLSATSVPLPTTLGGVGVDIGGRSAPILSISPTNLVVQVPWETPVGSVAVQVQANSLSSFGPVSAMASSLTEFPVFLVGPDSDLSTGTEVLAVHQDWSGLVTANNPARADEVVHLYGTGFGPIASPPPDGSPAPTNPLLPTTSRVACTVGNGTGLNATVLFAGLAPGLVGYYQVDVPLPSDLGPAIVLTRDRGAILPIFCEADGHSLQLGYFIPVATHSGIPR